MSHKWVKRAGHVRPLGTLEGLGLYLPRKWESWQNAECRKGAIQSHFNELPLAAVWRMDCEKHSVHDRLNG